MLKYLPKVTELGNGQTGLVFKFSILLHHVSECLPYEMLFMILHFVQFPATTMLAEEV